MGDKDAIKLAVDKLRDTLAFQTRVKEKLAAAAQEEEERQRQEQG